MTNKYWKEKLKEYKPRTWPGAYERLGGGEEGKPHSSKEGRIAAGKRKMGRVFRTKKFAGGPIIKKIITKLKPKGVFKKKEVDVDKLLKNLGDEIKAQPIPPKIQKKIKELQKAYPHHGSTGKLKE